MSEEGTQGESARITLRPAQPIANPLGDEVQIGSKEIPLDDSWVVTFRAAGEQDEPFLLGVYGSTRLEELALTGWDLPQREAFVRMQFDAQQLHYRQHYPNDEHLIILLDRTPVGRLYVANLETEIRIIDITILPEYRSAGIGTPIIQELMNEAEAEGKPLSIYVESFNRSRGLFERLGFVKTGESGYSHLLEWPRRETEDRRPLTADRRRPVPVPGLPSPVVRRRSSPPTDRRD